MIFVRKRSPVALGVRARWCNQRMLECVLYFFKVDNIPGIVGVTLYGWTPAFIAEIMPKLFVVYAFGESVMTFFAERRFGVGDDMHFA